MEQGSKEWHEYRNKRLGSSDAPVIMGVSPYKNIHDLFLEKQGRRKPSEPERFITEKGHYYEDLARLNLEDHTKLNWKPEVFVSEENDKWISSVDGHAVQNINLKETDLFWECKYVGKEKYNAFINELLPLRDRVSEQYYPQLIHHGLVTGGECGYFTVVVDHQVFKEKIEPGKLVYKHLFFRFSKDDLEYMHEIYKPELIKFTKSLETDTPPRIQPTEELIEVKDESLEKLINRLKVLKPKQKDFEDKVKELQELVYEKALAFGSKIEVAGNKITMSESEPNEFIDYELILKENPHLMKGIDLESYKRCGKTRVTRRISFKK